MRGSSDMGFDVEANEINKFANYILDQVLDDLDTIKVGAAQEGLNTEGFSGVLEPVAEVMDDFNVQLEEVCHELHRRLENLANALKNASQKYGDIDTENEEEFRREQRIKQGNEDARLGRHRQGEITPY